MTHDPLLTTLLDLDAALNDRKLIIGGGYGLFLKHKHLNDHPERRTLFSPESLPTARTTEDIDLILRAEVVTDSASMKQIRAALDTLGFRVVDTAKYTQFVRDMQPGQVKIDLLAAPLGEYASRVPKDPRRVKPRPSVKLHASKLEEAVAVARDALQIPIEGLLSNGEPHQTTILVPQAFSYLLMKFCAFRDRINDPDKGLGQHHALDIYRIVGMITREEDDTVRKLSEEYSAHPIVQKVRDIAQTDFIAEAGLGRLRIREHPLYQKSFDLDRLARELSTLLISSGNM